MADGREENGLLAGQRVVVGAESGDEAGREEGLVLTANSARVHKPAKHATKPEVAEKYLIIHSNYRQCAELRSAGIGKGYLSPRPAGLSTRTALF